MAHFPSLRLGVNRLNSVLFCLFSIEGLFWQPLPFVCLRVQTWFVNFCARPLGRVLHFYSLKRELEKSTNEKAEIHRHYVMVRDGCREGESQWVRERERTREKNSERERERERVGKSERDNNNITCNKVFSFSFTLSTLLSSITRCPMASTSKCTSRPR